MIPIMDNVKNEDEVLSVLRELDTAVLEAITLASSAEDPVAGYDAARNFIQMAFDEMQCPLIEGIVETSLFNILQRRVRGMMRELDELRDSGDKECHIEE